MSAAFSRRKLRRKLKSEINVVPYIDVMLVLLIIFMVTAPLLNLGVDVNLPESQARAVQTKKDPVEVTVDSAGVMTVKLPGSNRKVVNALELGTEIRSLVATNPEISVVISGDQKASYNAVYSAMQYVQAAGVEKMTLLSKAPQAR